MHSLAFLMTFVLARTSAVIDTHNDDCTLQQSLIHIEKVMRTVHGGSIVSVRCSSDVTLNKCEGTCESSVRPTVQLRSGYIKNCRCCRDTSRQPRQVILDRCTLNGDEIPVQKTLTVTEITGCSCQPCVD